MNAMAKVELEQKLKDEIIDLAVQRVSEEIKKDELPSNLRPLVEKFVDESLEATSPADVAMAIKHPEMFCDKCGECCRRCDPILVNMRDLTSISTFLGVDIDLVISNYTKVLDDGTMSLKARPCPFLDGNECSIHPVRPLVCKLFPLQISDGDVVPAVFKYCAFSKKLIAEKTFVLILQDIMKRRNPELYEKLMVRARKVEKELPNGWNEQVKWLVDSFS